MNNKLFQKFVKMALKSPNKKFAEEVKNKDVDIECLPICTAINLIPGIKTWSSCAGHCKTIPLYYGIGLYETNLTKHGINEVSKAIYEAHKTTSIKWFINFGSLETPETLYTEDSDTFKDTYLYWMKRPISEKCRQVLIKTREPRLKIRDDSTKSIFDLNFEQCIKNTSDEYKKLLAETDKITNKILKMLKVTKKDSLYYLY